MIEWNDAAVSKIAAEFGHVCAKKIARAIEANRPSPNISVKAYPTGVVIGGPWVESEYGTADKPSEPFVLPAVMGASLGDHG